MNDSSFRAVTSWLKRVNRLRLLRLRSKLWCETCRETRRVADFFGGSDVAVLECGHRRPVFKRTQGEISAYENAARENAARRQVVGKNSPTHNGYVRTFVGDMEEA